MDSSHGQTDRRAQYRTTSTSRAYILRLRRESTLGWLFRYVYHSARVIVRPEDQLFSPGTSDELTVILLLALSSYAGLILATIWYSSLDVIATF